MRNEKFLGAGYYFATHFNGNIVIGEIPLGFHLTKETLQFAIQEMIDIGGTEYDDWDEDESCYWQLNKN